MSILAAVLSAGPSLIRMFGSSKGGKTEEISQIVASGVEQYMGNPSLDNKAALQSKLDSLDPSVLSSMKVELEALENERILNAQKHDIEMHTQQQQTIRSSADVKGVRPAIASRSSWALVAYIFLFDGFKAFGYGPGANWELAMLIASPVLAWFGFRTWDKFSKQGASN